ncbi:HpcH/HpaI aldolase/citrate lyase family protein [Sphingomonas sp. CFBP 13706]|jgi:citrate lyase subunit beta/citryl-CoA lyase|uniref:HpcH/HpaI aldolase/citrate lyase family protein n=1 Tax=Sphingomonas sp. CFBP 13706 TaxID=2775314 RepID=UPI00177B2599|nr:CoA ester lyase [Sphingomonas sp. CFBP 13706]MBD8737135.1 CoA ester lyase [Sphingomonas sp. CFBP 13706]
MTIAARSILFVPGDRAERFEKARASGADIVVIDLEDAVLPDRKVAARDTIYDALASLREPRFFVRVNSLDTEWHADDVRGLAALPGVAGLMLPKAERASDFAAIHEAAPGKPLHALVETVSAVLNLADLVTAPGLSRLSFGTVDFQADAGIDGDQAEIDYVRTQIVLHSRSAGLAAPVDGVSTDLSNDEALARDTDHARRFGFGGKLCVHPRQVGIVNAAFLPSASDVDWATRVVAAIDGAFGAVAVDGKLIDKPVVDRARRVLDTYSAFDSFRR